MLAQNFFHHVRRTRPRYAQWLSAQRSTRSRLNSEVFPSLVLANARRTWYEQCSSGGRRCCERSTCVQRRAGVDDGTKNAILQKLIAERLVNVADASCDHLEGPVFRGNTHSTRLGALPSTTVNSKIIA